MRTAFTLIVLLGSGAALLAQSPTSPAVVPATPLNGDYYAAGNRIDVSRPIDGDVVIAGRTLTITKPVAGDILAAGWHVTLDTNVREPAA